MKRNIGRRPAEAPPNPQTLEEWQEAVDAAAAARALADCKMYGLLKAPPVNVERCDEILDGGRSRGIHPSRPATDLAIMLARAINKRSTKRN